MQRPPSKSRPRSERGFALIITITLLAFLVLLLVSLTTLTRVETQVASNNQQLAQARQNALMALNIAVGELQKYAGPDQRTTARADIDVTLADTTSANGRWTGVYGSSVTADYEATPEDIAGDLTDTNNVSTKGSPARLLNWLVSGNENTTFDPTADVADDGHITTAPTAFEFTPASPVDLTILSTSPTTTDTQTLLVASNSVTTPSDYVAAPLVKIEVPEGNLPGFSASSTTLKTIGRYAWWVGDEGMKARVNLPLAGTDPTLTVGEKVEQQRNAFSNSTRAAVELMGKDNHTDWADSPPLEHMIDSLYTPGQSVAGILAPSQTPLISSDPAAMSAALKHRFHDITAQSVSVLSDAYAGGLKRDLSILLDASYNSVASDPAVETADAKRMWTPHSGDDGTGGAFTAGFAIPTWKHLRSYAQTRIPTTGADALSLTARLPAHDEPDGTPDHVGVGPVITYFSMGFRVAPTATPAADVPIHMNLYPLVVIWNPYNFTLKAPTPEADGSNYEVGVYPTYNVQISLEKIIIDDTASPPTSTATRIASFDFQKSTAGGMGTYKFIRFRLNCPDIPPGQSLIFSLPHTSSGQLYNQKNILENIEPEAGAYVSIPFVSSGSPVTIAAGEENIDYQLTKLVSSPTAHPANYNFSSSFTGGGGIHIYLGQPDDASILRADSARTNYNPSSSTRQWYNTAQEMDWSGITASPPFQDPGPLEYDLNTSEPAYVFQAQALFSGAGSNDQLNSNQYMFATRWIAQGNMRAPRSGRTRRDNNFNVLYTATAGEPLHPPGFPWQKFLNAPGPLSNRASAGQGHDWIGGAPVDVTLFEFPYENQPLFSIGQLQHANLSLVGAYPSYPIGNSLADFRLVSGGSKFLANPEPEGWQLARVDKGKDAEGDSKLGVDMKGYYDISYLLNRTLWDRFYFSTVPATGTMPDTLANPRHIRYDATVNLQNPDQSSAGLVLAGGFNINSTSEHAWRAVLGAGNQVVFDPEIPDDTNPTKSLQSSFPRFTRPGSDDDPNNVWEGYRTLDENQIAQLAHNIVTEIRNRGPFVSLADFINRRLVDNPGSTGGNETFRGAIQAAIDSTTSSAVSGEFPANDGTGTFWTNDLLVPNATGGKVNQSSQFDYGYYGWSQVQGRLSHGIPAAAPYSNRSAFAPKYLTQADVLATIGSSLSARSDTFTIRTYGETVNPATEEVNGRAWCEAIVQRLPDYVENSLDSWDTPASGSASQLFGRKFKIISFRWLSPNDI